MQWIEVSVPTRSDEIDDVCAQLAELGAGGMVVEDEADFQDFLEHNHQYWDYVDDALEAQFRGVSRIKFYLADDDDGRAQLETIRAGIGRAQERRLADRGADSGFQRKPRTQLRQGDRGWQHPAYRSGNTGNCLGIQRQRHQG